MIVRRIFFALRLNRSQNRITNEPRCFMKNNVVILLKVSIDYF